MKFVRFLGFLLWLIPCVSAVGATAEFQNASKLLVAARNGDIKTVQALINAGADVNYVDSTGLSLVCTAVMNNDKRAIQILQMYGADASQCDRQIKQYKKRTSVAAKGESYGFFSGLSSTHVVALSAVGVAAVLGGVVLLSKAFDDDSGHGSSSSGSHSGGGGSSGSSTTEWSLGKTPYGPAYLTSSGTIDTGFDLSENLASWDTQSSSVLRKADFNYFRSTVTADNFANDGLYSTLQNYLLVMGGYYSLASGYMGQYIFRDDTHAPIKAQVEGAEYRPVRVALVTGNGINPAGSADSADGITYAIGTSLYSATPTVDKYLNNSLTDGNEVENSGYDLSGSGSAFNPFANVNETALAKIVAGWEGGRSSNNGDLYGFVPNGQLAIYRTGAGTVWNTIPNATGGTPIGTFTDNGAAGLSDGDVIVVNGITYNIADTTGSSLTIDGVNYELSSHSKLFVGECATSSGCSKIAIYVGTDGAWYIKSTAGNDIDAVYIVASENIYNYKVQNTDAAYTDFTAMSAAAGTVYNVAGETLATTVDVIANVNVLPSSRTNYITVNSFTTMADAAGATDLKSYYRDTVTNYYGTGQGGVAHSLFNGYSSSLPTIIMPAGDRLYKNGATGEYFSEDLYATFENYAPMIYGNNLKHNFMTVVAVSHEEGTGDAETIAGYGNGTGSAYGPIVLSMWRESQDANANIYKSRKCGIAGSGSAANGVDPWCFAASGPTAEMATAAAAGAVASVKAAFPYMSNDQVFTLLALTADGPYLGSNDSGKLYNNDTLAEYLRGMYKLPLSYDTDSLDSAEYLEAFKDVFGYGLINVSRAIEPGFAVYYYDSSTNSIVSSNGNNMFWGNVATSSSSSSSSSSSPRASTVLSLAGRGEIKTSFYDVIQSVDGSISLPRVWTNTFAVGNDSRHALYMGDVLADFNVDSETKRSSKVGNISIDMAMSAREYDDNWNGLDSLRVAFTNEKYDLDAQYQHYLTDGESRFSGRANGVLSLMSDTLSTGAKYKVGGFAFGGRAFAGAITDENLLDKDPIVSSQFEPARLGLANGAAVDAGYNNDMFALNMSVGSMRETNTVLGMYSDGLISLGGGDTKYVDVIAEYKPFDMVKLSLRGTLADTTVNKTAGLVSDMSNLRSNAFAFGADVGGFSFTAAMPLAVVDGRVGYDYAEFNVVENNGRYDVEMINPHVEYLDLSAQKRELRFSGSYKQPIGTFTDAGLGFIYRVHPNNTDVFGNESILMMKIHHRLGI